MSTIFHWFSTFDESLAMLGDLCVDGFEIIPDARYDSPSAPTFDRITPALAATLKEGPGFYLRGEPRSAVHLKRLEDGPARGSHIIDGLAGSLLQGMCARLNDVRGIPTLLMGSLSHPAKPAPHLRRELRRAVKIFDRRLAPDPIAKGFLISPAALELVRTGRAELKTTVLPGVRG